MEDDELPSARAQAQPRPVGGDWPQPDEIAVEAEGAVAVGDGDLHRSHARLGRNRLCLHVTYLPRRCRWYSPAPPAALGPPTPSAWGPPKEWGGVSAPSPACGGGFPLNGGELPIQLRPTNSPFSAMSVGTAHGVGGT